MNILFIKIIKPKNDYERHDTFPTIDIKVGKTQRRASRQNIS
jgi:hypothetical protein